MANGEQGLSIGNLYILRAGNRTEMIPRDQVSFVSEEYSDRPLFLILAILALLAAASFALSLQLQLASAAYIGGNAAVIAWLLGGAGVVLVLIYLGSRRGGVTIASSGGKIFVKTRRKARHDLISRIRVDLDQPSEAANIQEGDRREPTFSQVVPPAQTVDQSEWPVAPRR